MSDDATPTMAVEQNQPESEYDSLRRAVEDAIDDIDDAAEATGPPGVPMLHPSLSTARSRLEDGLDGEYPW